MRDADIVILDEATSSLDAQTEERIIDAVAESAKGKTVIIISHRFSTIRRADHVFYLEGGTVKESGTPSELIGKQGAFYAQYEKQMVKNS